MWVNIESRYKNILVCSLGKLEKESALNYLVEKVLLFVQTLYYFFTHFWVENYDDVGKNMLNHVSSYIRENMFFDIYMICTTFWGDFKDAF